MSHAKVAPEGLKPQECERNVGRSKPPIPYIPKIDVNQEAVDSCANTMLKLTLTHTVALCVPVWSKGTPEQFLVHIQQALDANRQKGLQSALDNVMNDKRSGQKSQQQPLRPTETMREGMKPPLRRKRWRKPLRLLPTKRRPQSLSLPRCSSYTPTYSQRKLGGPGARS